MVLQYLYCLNIRPEQLIVLLTHKIGAGIDGMFDAGNDVVQSGTDIWVIVKNGVSVHVILRSVKVTSNISNFP
jgi:hypothetical protein